MKNAGCQKRRVDNFFDQLKTEQVSRLPPKGTIKFITIPVPTSSTANYYRYYRKWIYQHPVGHNW